MNRFGKTLLRALALLFVAVVVPLVGVEVLMIVLEPYLSSGFYEYDRDMGFRVRAHANGTNEFGFNDKDYPRERSPGVFRVLILGDSVNWAGGLEGNYTSLLEQRLNADCPVPTVEVINAGYPGTHTAEQLVALQKFGLLYNPDMVILGFFSGNDFVDAQPHRKRIVVNDTYLDIDRREERVWFGYPIVPHSRFFHFLAQRYREFRAVESASDPGADPREAHEGGPGTFTEEAYLRIAVGRMAFASPQLHAERHFDENVEFIFESIDRMKRLLAERRIDFMVAIYPDEYQVDLGLARAVVRGFDLDPSEFDLDLPQRLLRSFLESRRIESVDLLERFRREGRGQRLFLLRNSHWNRAGNELAAEILFERLAILRPACPAGPAGG